MASRRLDSDTAKMEGLKARLASTTESRFGSDFVFDFVSDVVSDLVSDLVFDLVSLFFIVRVLLLLLVVVVVVVIVVVSSGIRPSEGDDPRAPARQPAGGQGDTARLHPVSLRRFPSFRTQPLRNIAPLSMNKWVPEQPSPWRKSSKRESCYGDRV